MSQLGLPPNYRFKVLNTTGATLSVVSLTMMRTAFNSAGEPIYEATVCSMSAVSSMANASAVYVGSAQSNASMKWLGLDGVLTVTASTATSGSVTLVLTTSPDGTTFSDASDLAVSFHAPLATLYFSTVTTKSVPFSL